MAFFASGPSRLRRLAALICAATYVLGCTGMLPQLLALAASLEGSHTILVAPGIDQVTVVLSHQRGSVQRPDYTPRHQAGNPQHHHGPAARLFCLLAEPAPAQADHTASFASGPLCESARCVVKVISIGADSPAHAPLSGLLSTAPLASPTCPSLLAARRPLRPPDTLLLLRSTVLVI